MRTPRRRPPSKRSGRPACCSAWRAGAASWTPARPASGATAWTTWSTPGGRAGRLTERLDRWSECSDRYPRFDDFEDDEPERPDRSTAEAVEDYLRDETGEPAPRPRRRSGAAPAEKYLEAVEHFKRATPPFSLEPSTPCQHAPGGGRATGVEDEGVVVVNRPYRETLAALRPVPHQRRGLDHGQGRLPGRPLPGRAHGLRQGLPPQRRRAGAPLRARARRHRHLLLLGQAGLLAGPGRPGLAGLRPRLRRVGPLRRRRAGRQRPAVGPGLAPAAHLPGVRADHGHGRPDVHAGSRRRCTWWN